MSLTSYRAAPSRVKDGKENVKEDKVRDMSPRHKWLQATSF